MEILHSAYRSWSISGTHVMAWLTCGCEVVFSGWRGGCVSTRLCGHACQTSFLYTQRETMCEDSMKYILAPCLSKAVWSICLCEVKPSLAVGAGIESHPIGFPLYLSNFTSHRCTGTQPCQSWETDMAGADQSGWWFGPEIGGEKASRWFPSSHTGPFFLIIRRHLVGCRKSFQQNVVSSGSRV